GMSELRPNPRTRGRRPISERRRFERGIHRLVTLSDDGHRRGAAYGNAGEESHAALDVWRSPPPPWTSTIAAPLRDGKYQPDRRTPSLAAPTTADARREGRARWRRSTGRCG